MSGRSRTSGATTTYRFDPHPGQGGIGGVGLLRSVLIGTVLTAAVLTVYAGLVIHGVLLLLVCGPIAFGTWDGMPLLLWLPLRLAYRLTGPSSWELDPELVGTSDPITTPNQETPDVHC